MIKQIVSTSNPLIKTVELLSSKSKERKNQNKFICEGIQEIQHCINSNYSIENIIYCSETTTAEDIVHLGISEEKYISVSMQVFAKIAYRKDVKNALAIVHSKSHLVQDIAAKNNPLYLVMEGIEKPGNLGAILRSADACAVDAVLLVNPVCDMYNPNVIRSSVGSVFTVPVAIGSAQDILEFLIAQKVNIFTTFMSSATPAWQCNLSGSTAIVLGSEHSGLSAIWRNPAYTNITIPMLGKMDSLNVSVATALLLYESVRQRKA